MKYVKRLRRQPWVIRGQLEFNFDEEYITNFPPLKLDKYEGDRNYNFYKYQNELLLYYNEHHEVNKEILWKMYPYIEGVVESIAKKTVCTGCKVPDFGEKCLEATTRILNHYGSFPYYRARKLENVAFHKVREVFLNGNLRINERAADYNVVLENELEKEKTTQQKKKLEEKTVGEIKAEKLEEKELKEIKEFHYWQIRHKRKGGITDVFGNDREEDQ